MGFDFWPRTLELHHDRDVPPILGGACCPDAEGLGLTGVAVPAEGSLVDTYLWLAKRLVVFLCVCWALCGCPGGSE